MAAAVIVLMGAAIRIFVHPGLPSVTIAQRLRAPQDFAASAALEGHTFVTTNRRTLIKYDYTTGQYQPLSPDTGEGGLTGIDTLSISADKQYILFHSSLAQAGTLLASKITELGLEPSRDYWWIFSLQKQIFLPLPQGVLLAKFDGAHVYTLTYGSNGTVIGTIDPATATQTTSVGIAPSSNFFVAKNGFLVETSGGDVSFTKDGVVTQHLFKAMNIVGVTADKQWALATKTKGSSVSLWRINLQDNSVKNLANNLVGTPAWLNNTTLLYATNGDQASQNSTIHLYTYAVPADKTTVWKFAKSAVLQKGNNASPVTLLGNTTAILGDASGNNYLVGNNLHELN